MSDEPLSPELPRHIDGIAHPASASYRLERHSSQALRGLLTIREAGLCTRRSLLCLQVKFLRRLCYKIMMDHPENPKARWLDIVPTVHEGRESFLLRDPEGITDNALLVSRDVLFLISLMNGTRSMRDIQLEFMKASGLFLQEDRVASVIRTLDDHFLMLNARYEGHVSRLMEEYRALPFRNACLAGKSYPFDGEALRSYLASFVNQELAPVKDRVKGMITPHIDYARGLEVYGPIYRYLPRDENTLFVVFGTCHKLARKVWSIALRDVVTPLGRVRGAGKVGGLISQDPYLRDYVDEWPHRNEHSIELQLPMMQFLMKERQYEVLSILTGSLHEYMEDGKHLDQGEIPELVRRLKEAVRVHEGPVVFVAAADLAHIGAQFGDIHPLDAALLEESKERDHELLRTVTVVDAAAFFETVRREGDKRRICGLAPIYFVLSMLDSSGGELIEYRQWTDGASSVSFAGAVFY